MVTRSLRSGNTQIARCAEPFGTQFKGGVRWKSGQTKDGEGDGKAHKKPRIYGQMRQIMSRSGTDEATDHENIYKGLKANGVITDDDSNFIFPGTVHTVNNFADEEKAMTALLSDYEDSIAPLVSDGVNNPVNIRLVGLDTETKPSFHKGVHNPSSLVQVSSKNHAVVYQLMSKGILYEGRLPPYLEALLADPGVVKCGVGVESDVMELMFTYGISIRSVLELNSLLPGRTSLGLKTLAKEYLGKSIFKDKHVTCSNWEREVLTPLQEIYAATDAFLGVAISGKLLSNVHPVGCVPKRNLVDFTCNFLSTGPGLYTRQHLGKKRMTSTVLNKANMARGRISDRYVELYSSALVNFAKDKSEERLRGLLLPPFLPRALRKEYHHLAYKLGLFTQSFNGVQSKRRPQQSPTVPRYLTAWRSKADAGTALSQRGWPMQ